MYSSPVVGRLRVEHSPPRPPPSRHYLDTSIGLPSMYHIWVDFVTKSTQKRRAGRGLCRCGLLVPLLAILWLPWREAPVERGRNTRPHVNSTSGHLTLAHLTFFRRPLSRYRITRPRPLPATQTRAVPTDFPSRVDRRSDLRTGEKNHVQARILVSRRHRHSALPAQ